MHPYSRAKMASLRDCMPGQVVKIACRSCRVTRYYRPDDLHQLLGDLIAPEIERKFRCDTCGSKDDMRADFVLPYGDEITKITVRHLVEIRMVRKAVWRDGKL